MSSIQRYLCETILPSLIILQISTVDDIHKIIISFNTTNDTYVHQYDCQRRLFFLLLSCVLSFPDNKLLLLQLKIYPKDCCLEVIVNKILKKYNHLGQLCTIFVKEKIYILRTRQTK